MAKTPVENLDVPLSGENFYFSGKIVASLGRAVKSTRR